MIRDNTKNNYIIIIFYYSIFYYSIFYYKLMKTKIIVTDLVYFHKLTPSKYRNYHNIEYLYYRKPR